MLQHGFVPEEVAYDDAMAMPFQSAINKGKCVLGHGEGRRMFVSALLHEGDLKTVDDWL